MRFAIISILFMSVLNVSYGFRAHIITKKYVKNMNNAIYQACNKEAHCITRNTDIYECLKVNHSENCSYLTNFTEYNKIRLNCVKEKNMEIGSGVLIWLCSILIFSILRLSF